MCYAVLQTTDYAIWIWVVLVGVAAGVTAGIIFGLRYAFRRTMRHFLVGLISSREQILASRRTLEAVMRHLADEPDEALLAFAADSRNEDRRVLREISSNMRLLRDDLDTRRLPRRLHPVATALADVAHLLAQEADKITKEMSAEEVLEQVGEIDLRLVSSHYDMAAGALEAVCEEYEIEEAVVYGGGLYI